MDRKRPKKTTPNMIKQLILSTFKVKRKLRIIDISHLIVVTSKDNTYGLDL
jgi:hypothetical protein